MKVSSQYKQSYYNSNQAYFFLAHPVCGQYSMSGVI